MTIPHTVEQGVVGQALAVALVVAVSALGFAIVIVANEPAERTVWLLDAAKHSAVSVAQAFCAVVLFGLVFLTVLRGATFVILRFWHCE